MSLNKISIFVQNYGLNDQEQALKMNRAAQAKSDTQIDKVQRAANALAWLANKDLARGERRLFFYEIEMLENNYKIISQSERFREHLVRSLRVALYWEDYQVALFLLGGALPDDFLSSESDILPSAICGDMEGAMNNVEGYEDMISVVKRLVSRGAQINARDDKGHTALYYACHHGYLEIFHYLMDVGADHSTVHRRENNSNSKNGGDEVSRTGVGAEQNLLQVALTSYAEVNSGGILFSDAGRVCYLRRQAPVILRLLDTGLSFDSCSRHLILFFYISCFEGDKSSVDKVLDIGVDINIDKPCMIYKNYRVGSALHAAIAGGHASVVELLIRRKADVNSQRTFGQYRRGMKSLTPSAMICHLMSKEGKPPNIELKRMCELLLTAGLEEHDKESLLHGCATAGHLDLAERLLQDGCLVEEVPICGNIEGIQLLLKNGARIDWDKAQEYAVKNLEYLAYQAMLKGHIPMLRYLLAHFGESSNDSVEKKTLEGFDNQLINQKRLLEHAIMADNPEAVEMILQETSDIHRRGLCDFALGYARQCMTDDHISTGTMLVPRVILNYGKDSTWVQECIQSIPPSSSYAGLRDMRTKAAKARYAARKEQSVLQYVYATPHGVENEKDMEAFLYTDLSGLDSIRLLELDPSESPQDPLHCHLVERELSQNPEYEALSYVWGDASEKTTICVNGCRFQVTVNLWSALFRLRRKQESRWLWVDAVCINQENTQERNQQVRIMRDIYQAAEYVIIWLGEHADQSHLIFQDNETEENTEEYLEAAAKLCSRPWFFRTWVLQEICLANRPVIACGSDVKVWRSLGRLFTWAKRSEVAYHPVYGVDGWSHFINLNRLEMTNSLEYTFRYSRVCHASDPKDRIYGVLGIFRQQLIPVDYNTEVTEIYRQFTESVIRKEGTVDILHWFRPRKGLDGLCSWVPDYGLSGVTGILPWLWDDERGSQKSGFRFRGKDLIINGKHLGIVKEIGCELVSDGQHIPGSEGFSRVLYEWESLATKVQYKGCWQTAGCAFKETLSAGNHETRRDFSKTIAFASWYDVYGTGIVAQADTDYLNAVHLVTQWTMPNGMRDIEKRVDRYAELMEPVCYGRRLFITNSSMGLAPPRTQPGDQIVFLSGGWYPFILRECDRDVYEMIGDCYLEEFNLKQPVDWEHDPDVKEFTIC